MQGAWRNKNGVPINRVKQLAPAKSKQQIAEEQFMFQHRKNMIQADRDSYQRERRYRKTLGRDIMTGVPTKPRRVCAGPEQWWNNKFGRRFKKPTVLVTEGQAQMEAANDGVIGEPDTDRGRADWERYRDREKGWKPVELPDD